MSAESNRSFEEQNTALFAGLVMQQANAALMCLGKGKHPGTGEETIDLDSARYLIDQLEMLAVKTKGNLSPQEEAFLKQSLMTARLTFVETANAAKAPPAAPSASLNASTAPNASSADPAAPAPSASKEETGGKAKFVKKY